MTMKQGRNPEVAVDARAVRLLTPFRVGIGLPELTRKANELVVSEFRPLEIYSFLILEYLLLILAASWAVRRLERRMAASERRES